MTSGVYIINAHILASKFSWKYDLNMWELRVFIGLTNLHRAVCSLTVCHTAFRTMRYMMELLEAVGTQQEGEGCTCMSMRDNSPTRVRWNMHTLPSNASMHSHMRRPTPIYLSSKLSLKSHPHFLWLGFPLSAFVAGHNTPVIHFLHKCSVLQLSLHTCALLLSMPTPITKCCFRIGGYPLLWSVWFSFLLVMLRLWEKQRVRVPG